MATIGILYSQDVARCQGDSIIRYCGNRIPKNPREAYPGVMATEYFVVMAMAYFVVMAYMYLYIMGILASWQQYP